MPHYRVFLNGQNFWLEFDQRRRRVGFFTTRFVEAADQRTAETAAVGALRAERKLGESQLSLKGTSRMPAGPPPNKALQLMSAAGPPSAFLWRSQQNTGTLDRRSR